MCEHNVNKEKHDIFLYKKTKTMEYPERFRGICLICNESLTFIKVKDVYVQI